MLFSTDGGATNYPIHHKAGIAAKSFSLDISRDARGRALALWRDHLMGHRASKRNFGFGARNLDCFAPGRSPLATGSTHACHNRRANPPPRMVDGVERPRDLR